MISQEIIYRTSRREGSRLSRDTKLGAQTFLKFNLAGKQTIFLSFSSTYLFLNVSLKDCTFYELLTGHPRRPRGSQSGSGEISRKSFQEWAKKPLGTKSYRTISKRLRDCRLLIGHKKSFVLLCPIGEQQLSSHFRVFLHADCCLALLVHQGYACE